MTHSMCHTSPACKLQVRLVLCAEWRRQVLCKREGGLHGLEERSSSGLGDWGAACCAPTKERKDGEVNSSLQKARDDTGRDAAAPGRARCIAPRRRIYQLICATSTRLRMGSMRSARTRTLSPRCHSS